MRILNKEINVRCNGFVMGGMLQRTSLRYFDILIYTNYSKSIVCVRVANNLQNNNLSAKITLIMLLITFLCGLKLIFDAVR